MVKCMHSKMFGKLVTQKRVKVNSAGMAKTNVQIGTVDEALRTRMFYVKDTLRKQISESRKR